jgi:hypothetical protein
LKKKIAIAISAVLLIASIVLLGLYQMGGMILDSAIDSALADTASGSDLPTGTDAGSSTSAPEMQTSEAVPGAENSTALSQNANKTTGTDSIDYSTEQIKEIKDTVAPADQISISAMVLSKLSPDDVSYLSGLLQGGLTKEEKQAAKKLCYARFSSDEIKKICDYYKEYTAGK